MSIKHVIIGAGPAGVIAAETIRKLDREADIRVLGEEPEPPYSRMALPYLLKGRIDESGTWLRKNEAYYDTLRIEIFRDRVTVIDTEKGSVRVENGNNFNFDQLLIATGSSPVTPPIPGIDQTGVYCCWTLADARNILARAKPGSEIVLIGAGFIGCILLEALASHNVKVSVVEMADRMVPRMMDLTAGRLIKQWCENRGVTVYTSAKVTSLEKTENGMVVNLDNKAALHADLVITATGVKPNMDFLDTGTVDMDTGILVNENLQTSRKNIYAAGDVCQGRDFSTGGFSVQAIQPTAADHGRIAAMNMCGRMIKHEGCINMNILDTMGLISTSFGMWMGAEGGESVTLKDDGRFRYLRLSFADDILIGAQTLGLTEHIGIIRGLIQARIKLGKWKARLMNDPTHIMEAWLGCTQPVGHNAGIIR